MKRKSFFANVAGIAASGMAAPLAAVSSAEDTRLVYGDTAIRTSGVRRLGKDKYFNVFRNGLEPRYKVVPGEIVLVETSHGLPELVTRDGTFKKSGPGDVINPMTGPVYVEGVEPGDAVAIDILEIKVDDWGYAGGRIFEISDGYVIFDDKLKLRVSPMIGGVGIVPAEGTMDTKTPCATGGNMDCKEIRAGSTLVLTAQVPGALVGMGDAHALQGDGEVRGQGIETGTETLVKFRKLPEPLSERPVIVRDEFVATVGAHEDLNKAAWQAVDDMNELIVKYTGRTKEDAYQLVNLVGNLKINQIVDPAKGARMEVPSWVFGV
jgi:amidase